MPARWPGRGRPGRPGPVPRKTVAYRPRPARPKRPAAASPRSRSSSAPIHHDATRGPAFRSTAIAIAARVGGQSEPLSRPLVAHIGRKSAVASAPPSRSAVRSRRMATASSAASSRATNPNSSGHSPANAARGAKRSAKRNGTSAPRTPVTRSVASSSRSDTIGSSRKTSPKVKNAPSPTTIFAGDMNEKNQPSSSRNVPARPSSTRPCQRFLTATVASPRSSSSRYAKRPSGRSTPVERATGVEKPPRRPSSAVKSAS